MRKLKFGSPILLCSLAVALFAGQPLRAEEHTELGKQMEAMNNAVKAMRKEADPVKGAELARQAQDAVLKAIAQVPETVGKLPEAERPKATASYRTMMGKVFVSFSEMEEAYIAKDLEKVKKISEELRTMKKSGHEHFMDEDE